MFSSSINKFLFHYIIAGVTPFLINTGNTPYKSHSKLLYNCYIIESFLSSQIINTVPFFLLFPAQKVFFRFQNVKVSNLLLKLKELNATYDR